MLKIQQLFPDLHLDDSTLAESQIQGNILKYLKKVPDSFFTKIAQCQYSHVGVADVVGVINGTFVALEVKTAKGKPSAAQVVYLNSIIKAGGVAAIVRSVKDTKEAIKEII